MLVLVIVVIVILLLILLCCSCWLSLISSWLSCLAFEELFVEGRFSRCLLCDSPLRQITRVLRNVCILEHLLCHRLLLCGRKRIDSSFRIIFAHFKSLAATCLSLFSLSGGKDWRKIGLPLCPVSLDELCHVLGFGVWVLQIDVSRLLSALIRIPICRNSPWFGRGIKIGFRHYPQR